MRSTPKASLSPEVLTDSWKDSASPRLPGGRSRCDRRAQAETMRMVGVAVVLGEPPLTSL